MSVINPTLAAGFSAADSAIFGHNTELGGAPILGPFRSDAIALGPEYGPPASVAGPAAGESPAAGTGGGYSGIMAAFMNAISAAFASLGGMFGGSGGGANAAGDAYFAQASASSLGDPHDTFNATTGSGTAVTSKWDSMAAHPDLLHSDSFAGGYRVSTTATAPQANGVTYNASATVATDGGRTGVTMNANGSYAVVANGRDVSLTAGTTTTLDNHEAVTLNADGSLTVDVTNQRDGSIATTLKSNGPGVDVTATAAAVDLGGYLVRRADAGLDPSAASAPPALPATQPASTPFATPNPSLPELESLF